MTRSSKVHNSLYGILLLIISTLLCFFAFELVLRCGIIENPAHLRAKNLLTKSEGIAKSRIMILGDSFIVTGGALSTGLTAELSGNSISVLNIALPGMGPYEYLSEMGIFYKSFRPNIILISYYVGNDLTDVQYNFEHWEENNLRTKVRNALRPLVRRLYAYLYFNRLRITLKIKRLQRNNKSTENFFSGNDINPLRVKMARTRPNYLLDNILIESKENLKAWKKVKDLLLSVKNKSDEIGAKLVVVIFPRSIQIDRSHFELFEQSGFHVSEKTLNSRKPQDLLLEFCEENSISCLDLLPVFKKHSGPDKQLYLSNDDHLNATGRNIAKEEIVLFLNEFINNPVGTNHESRTTIPRNSR